MAQQNRNGENNEEGGPEEARSPREERLEREADALKARLGRLSEALDAQGPAPCGRQTGGGSQPGGLGSAYSLAMRVLSEFVAAVMVGTAIGWGIDWLAGTSPVFLIVFVLMGAAAGFWNVYRIAMGKPGGGGREF